jgi:hypothetical protein
VSDLRSTFISLSLYPIFDPSHTGTPRSACARVERRLDQVVQIRRGRRIPSSPSKRLSGIRVNPEPQMTLCLYAHRFIMSQLRVVDSTYSAEAPALGTTKRVIALFERATRLVM